MTRGLSLSFLLLTACIPESPKTELGVDNDGDGYVAVEHGGDDCDDANPARYPGAVELCDGLDNDCDLSISDVEIDSDGDGYVGCIVEEGGWTGPDEPTGGNDCVEGDPTIHPDADEHCDGLDHDCDGEINEDDAVDAPFWLIDSDGDTWGVVGTDHPSCAEPVNTVSAADAFEHDCNDNDPTVFPGADELCDGQLNDCRAEDGATPSDEIDSDEDNYVECGPIDDGGWDGPEGLGPDDCDDQEENASPAAIEACDGIDNNCDGTVDEQGATGETAWYADTDEDGHGDPANSLVGCDQPSDYVLDDTDCNDTDETVNPGAAELCDGQDNDCDGALPTVESDADGDGYVVCAIDPDGWDDGAMSSEEDCDDTDSLVNPGAIEFCDSIDNNCDTLTDGPDSADAVPWFEDFDGDGYGNVQSSQIACTPPANHVIDHTDCDDTDPDTHPGATEFCNNIDNNCDFDVDDDDDVTDGNYASGSTIWYQDGDGDNYGLSSDSVFACSQPSGYAPDMGDCDDGLASVSPAATEVCGNGVDDNCSNTVDDNTSQTSWISWYRDDDSDGYGQPGNSISACAAPSGYSTTGGDCNDANSAVNPGVNEVCNNNIDDNCNVTVDEGCGNGGSGENNPTTCDDGNDNDGDSYTDCYDCDCSYLTTLCSTFQCQGGGSNGSTCSGGASTECDDSNCSDGQDNDGDSLIDCCDSDCASTTYCVSGTGTCNNTTSSYEVCTGTGADEDGDNTADCSDTDCTDVFTPSCFYTPTPNSVAGGLTSTDHFAGVDCGGMHTCVLVLNANGGTEPECWGDDSKGQSTIPTAQSSPSLSLTVDEEYAGIATGGLHTCVAINHSNGVQSRAVCWGDDSKGQAGSRSISHEIQQITAGTAHTCALFNDGTVYCWGDSTYGATTPPTGGNSTFQSIDAGGYHTCGILDHNAQDPYGIKCWGRNDQAQAGSDLLNMFDYVAAGDLHTCGVTTGGSIVCWGNNDYSQTSNKPSAATAATGSYERISSNGHHTCLEILGTTGIASLNCWGWGDTGTGFNNGQTNTTTTTHATSAGIYLGFCAGGRHTFSAASGSGGSGNDYGFSGDTSAGQNLCSSSVPCQ